MTITEPTASSPTVGAPAPAASGTSLDAHALPVLTGSVFRNPVPFDVDPLPTNPDPFVLRHRGRYYCFSSGHDGIGVSVSDDLVTWRRLGTALTQDGRCEFWAPCVARIDGTFYLYFSSRAAGSGDPHDEQLHVAASARIEGPYTVVRRLSDRFVIDPHVVRDPGGDWFMFYSTNEPTGLDRANVGTSVLVDRMTAPTVLGGSPRAVILPSIEEEIFERDRFGAGRDWYTIEGAAYFTHHGRGFLTYSGNAYTRPDYFIGYATAEVDGPIGALTWRKHPNDLEYAPLVRRSEHVEGTGHNSVVVAPNLVDRWIVYHGRDAAVPILEGVEQRVMRIDPLLVSGGRLLTPAPSSADQDAPATPTVAGGFGADGAPTNGWSVVDGAASVHGGVLRTPDDDDALVLHAHRTECYVAELWLQATISHVGARAGVVPWYVDPTHWIEACLDASTSSLVARRCEAGFVTELGAWPIPRGSMERGCELRVERTFDQVEVWVDDQAAGRFEVPSGPAQVGVRTVRTAAEVDGFALTDHVALHGERLRFLPRDLVATPPARLDATGVASRSRRALALDGAPATPGWEVTYDLAIDAAYGRVDLHPVHGGDAPSVRVRLVPDGYRIDLVEGHVTTAVAVGSMPWARRASVRVRALVDRLVIHVDDRVHVVPCAVTGARSRLELVGARLVSFERTSHTPWIDLADVESANAEPRSPQPRSP